MRRHPDLALFVLGLIGLGAALMLDFLLLAPNRLLSGHAIVLTRWPLVASWAGLCALAWWPRPRVAAWAGAWLAVALIVGTLALAGVTATRVAGTNGIVRVQLGAGCWLTLVVAVWVLLDRLRAGAPRPLLRGLCLLVPVAALLAMAYGGLFDQFALVREYRMQQGRFATAVLQHLALATAAVVGGLLVGLPLAWAAWRRPRWRGSLLGSLNLIQTLPSIALFALLIGPLAWLSQQAGWLQAVGIGGTGAAPAVLALAAYALLPIVRYTLAGLAGVPDAAIDAARGMGMTGLQILRQVQLPLALPVLVAGLRIVAVQAIGLATVAALIGAGGLGRFVFLGLGQGATDLVMLGTLAIIALALAVNALFEGLRIWTEPRT
jgi:osmoprotectant transport system permease protein